MLLLFKVNTDVNAKLNTTFLLQSLGMLGH